VSAVEWSADRRLDDPFDIRFVMIWWSIGVWRFAGVFDERESRPSKE
jgi:hypothetical protein